MMLKNIIGIFVFGIFVTPAIAEMSAVGMRDVKIQNIAQEIKGWKICGPVTILDKTGHKMFEVAKDTCFDILQTR